MGRCIVREPKVFLFDEPLSNLDAKLRVQMRLELRNLHENLRITSIYVTHDQVEAMTLGDRLIVMNNGYAEQIGAPLEVYEKPATSFVAGFIGSPAMNLLQVKLSGDGRHIKLPGDLQVPLPEQGCPDYGGETVTLGVRPEHFTLAQKDNGSIQMLVDHVETLGADTLVHGRLNNEAAIVTVRLTDIRHFAKHQPIDLNVSSEKIHLFDVDTKKRINIY